MATTIAQTPTNLNTLSVELTGRPATMPAADPFRQAVRQVSELAHAKLPEALHGRLERGVALVLHGLVWPEEDGTFTVQASDGAGWYRVNGHCGCRDASTAPEGLCKHRLGSLVYRRAAQLVREHTTPTPAVQAFDAAPVAAAATTTLPEAPASVNVHVMMAGRQVQVTLRGTDETVLLERLAKLLAQYPCEKPATPAPPAATAAMPSETPVCPWHGTMKASTKDAGTWYCPGKMADGSYCKERWPAKAKRGARR
jgi:hypothetical protein